MTDFRGELAALSAAFLWAVTTVIYGRVGARIPALHLNFLKGAIAIAFLSIMLLATRASVEQLNWLSTGQLLLSGAIGIGLGDTAYFKTLNNLGARRTLLLETLAPPLTAAIALVFLGEQLKLISWCGIFLTILGVAWVISEGTSDRTLEWENFRSGLFWGLLSEIAQACGVVLSRAALAETPVTPVWSTLLRLSASAVVLLALLGFQQKRRKFPKIEWSVKLLGIITLTAFFGTFVALILQQTAIKFSPAGIAQTLTSTSTLFVIPITAAMGERVSIRAILGTLVAIAGIFLLFR
jgi:drug/metabolite transporter (DMT)-like permease